MTDKLKYSVIVLLEEHNENLIEYIEALDRIFSERNDPYEILILANGTEGLLKNKLNPTKKHQRNAERFRVQQEIISGSLHQGRA